MYKKPFCNERKSLNAERCFIVCSMLSSSSTDVFRNENRSLRMGNSKRFFTLLTEFDQSIKDVEKFLNKISNGSDSDRSARLPKWDGLTDKASLDNEFSVEKNTNGSGSCRARCENFFNSFVNFFSVCYHWKYLNGIFV